MATIDELMAGKAPGSVKLAGDDWDHCVWFAPYYREKNGFWHGLDWMQCSRAHNGTEDAWQVWQEPKKAVMRWKWVFQECDEWNESVTFMTEQEAGNYFYAGGYKKLEYTRTEFEE